MGGITYQFTDENDRTCDVMEKSHQERFLASGISYREVVSDEVPVVKEPARRVKVRRFVPVPPQADVTHEGVE